jgi:hypothetical protein
VSASRIGRTSNGLGAKGSAFSNVPVTMRNALVWLALILAAPAWPQERPLPDFQTFLQEARKRLQADDVRQSEYVYLETRRERKLDKSGRTTKETLNVFESYPALPGESRWQRQTVKDGRPLSAEDLAKQDRERQKKVLEYAGRMERDPAKMRAAQEKKRAEALRDTERAVDDALIVYEFKMLGREVVGGHETVAISFTPRKATRPKTREGKVMKHFAGKAWVSEAEYELVRLEAEAIETASFGLGLLARVHKGSKAAFERRKVNGEEWLPARASYTATARVMLLKMLRIGGTSEFSDYRKFMVETETRIGKPGSDEEPSR